MIQTTTCLYCNRPFIDSTFTCQYSDCPSKHIQTYAYCLPPCDLVKELDARVKELEKAKDTVTISSMFPLR
jgi:hypothetical protein